ncbi:hypothetical protein [Paenibacillus phocaensis]|uniref:hypothetical protein n=1 Tax=Paenibacillus phocaensis TaxID=1776378 RepID=UPI0003A37319|nr:hypothetical protein [Paenibacillus phocaensis]
MKIGRYLSHLIKDWMIASGGLTVMTAIYLSVSTTERISATWLWQIVIAAAAFTFYKYALVNKYEPELSPKVQIISFALCYALAAVMLLLWLWLASPNPMIDTELLWILIAVILVVKGMAYAMMFIDGHKEARQLNQKLSEYREGRGE